MNDKKAGASQTLPVAMLAVAVFGVLLTLTIELSYKYTWIMEICGGGQSGCADVASTPFARIPMPMMENGLSVAYLGLLVYVSFIFCQVYFPRLTLPIASAMMGAEFYFLWVMASILGIFCMFCVIQFVTVSILFLLTMAWGWKRTDHILPGGKWANVAVVALAFVIPTAPVVLKKGSTSVMEGEYLTYAGDPASRIRVEIFSDFQCPYCQKIEPEVEKIMKLRPDVLVVFRDYIIPSHGLSPFAVSFANGVALTQGREAFIRIRREMFENQNRLRDYLEGHKDMVEFTPELRKRIEKKVEGDLKVAESLNIYSTPTLVVYRDGKMAQIIKAGDATYDKISRFIKP
ncbi:MAG: thioredoxin domain-containing protein [Nitrospinota bacterium]|nr:thioredoxin domain-containing protein [Nitrospinota bacterium]